MTHQSPHQLIAETATLSDAELVARAKQGEALAFEVIIRRNNQLLFRAARSRMPDDAAAQDMLQEAYLRAFTHLDSFRGDASLRTWLTRIVINQCNSQLRKRRHLVALDDDYGAPQGEETIMPSQLTDKHSPEVDVDRQQMTQLLQHAISQLSDSYRSVFMLREVEGMSVRDTAYCLDISEDLVKTRLSRARAQLRERLTAQLQGQLQDSFEFAGRRCDAVTEHVLQALRQQGLVR